MEKKIDPTAVVKAVSSLLRVHHVIKFVPGTRRHCIVGTFLSFKKAKEYSDSCNYAVWENDPPETSFSFYVKTCLVGKSNDMLLFIKQD